MHWLQVHDFQPHAIGMMHLTAWNLVPPDLKSFLWETPPGIIFASQVGKWSYFFNFSFLMYLLVWNFLLHLLCFLDCCPFSHFVFSILLIGGNEPSSGRNSPLPYRPDSRPLTPTYAQAPKHFHVPGRSRHVSVLVSCRRVECSLVTSSRLHFHAHG